MTCIVLVSGTLPDFRWVKWDDVPSTYPNSLDFERGSYTLVDPVQYETVHVEGKYGVKVNIRNVTSKDFGLYTCYVSNHLGSDYRSAFLSESTDRWKGSKGKSYIQLKVICESGRIVRLLKSVLLYKESVLPFIHLSEVVFFHFISTKLSGFFSESLQNLTTVNRKSFR